MKEALQQIGDLWDMAAKRDAMGYILTTGQTWNIDDFYAHGREEIGVCLSRLDDLGLRGARRRRALDFGCGIGRLTQALADHYDRVIGVDLSPTMIELAEANNRHGARVQYFVNDEKLSYRSGTFDLIYTMIVLQHMPQEFAHQYIRDFIRMLHRDGLVVFEIPDGPDIPHSDPCLSMYGTPRRQVEEIVTEAGGEIVDVENVNPCTWDCNRYTARRTR